MKKFKGVPQPKPPQNYGKTIGWIMGAILILSTFGFILGNTTNNDTTTTYNGYAIEATPEGLFVNIAGRRVSFSTYPDAISDLKPDQAIVDLVKNTRALVITYNPNEERPELFGGAQYALEQELTDTYVMRALTNATGYELPELTCANATALAPVLYYVSGNTTRYTLKNNCIIGEVTIAEDVNLLKDAFLYSYYGVFP